MSLFDRKVAIRQQSSSKPEGFLHHASQKTLVLACNVQFCKKKKKLPIICLIIPILTNWPDLKWDWYLIFKKGVSVWHDSAQQWWNKMTYISIEAIQIAEISIL